MVDGKILLFYTKIWVALFFLPTAFVNSKLAAENIEHVQRRKLATENPGFISIDCGVDEDYLDEITGIFYKSDKDFISTGTNKVVAPAYSLTNTYYGRQMNSLRMFPEGKRNCYTLKPKEGKNHNYDIRVFFRYGNYDFENLSPTFDLYLGVNFWATVAMEVSWSKSYSIIHYSSTDTIYLCLINTGFGVPFISGLNLRLLNDSIYRTATGISLSSAVNADLGSDSTQSPMRYKDDVYDRFWWYYNLSDSVPISTTTNIDIQGSDDPYRLPVEVLKTAVRPQNGSNSLSYSYTSNNDFLVYFHFAEIEQISQGQVREFTITLNGIKYGPFTLEYLKPLTISPNESTFPADHVNFSIDATLRSDLPPILNAFEIFTVWPLPKSPTNQADVDAIMAIKKIYGMDRADWQGDPCLPITPWTGLNCSSDSAPRIISLNLSSSHLTGKIAVSLLNLTAIQSLDLSNNGLTGTVPEDFVQLPNLTSLYLNGNSLTGSVPRTLKEKSNNGLLRLSLDGNPDLCQMDPCAKKKQSSLLPVIASVVSILVFLVLSIAIFWWLKRGVTKSREGSSMKSKNQPFTYAEIVSIANNFRTIIGEGGFGKVYLGNLKDGTKVAIKMLSHSSRQGYKEFLAEIKLLMIVHHKNLVSLIGYCDQNGELALVYEYMENGNLHEHLSETSKNLLNWRERLQIAVDTAQGLEYLHNGCKPPIVHRDLKASNILLTENFQAKIADFGLSKAFETEIDSHITTRPAGTPGYLDPEFRASGKLNKKSDVYSFGILLFELITGRPVIIRGHDSNTHILQWVSPIIETGDVQSIVDPRLQGEFSTTCAWKALDVALSCVPQTAVQRADMSYVLVELKECLAMEVSSERTLTQSSATRMSNSIGMTLASDTDMAPHAR